MEKIINLYFKDEYFRTYTLKEALIKTKNITPSWFNGEHPDFDLPLIDIMANKVENWHQAGYDTSKLELSIIVKEFNKYEKLYKVLPPPDILHLLEEIKTIKAYRAQLRSLPETENTVTAENNINLIITKIEQKIDELS